MISEEQVTLKSGDLSENKNDIFHMYCMLIKCGKESNYRAIIQN